MKFPLDFVTHYHGNTDKTRQSKERLVWATTEIEIPEFSRHSLEVALQDNSAYEPKPKHDGHYRDAEMDKVFSFGGHYYTSPENACASRKGDRGICNDHYNSDGKLKGRRNFGSSVQRAFTWNAFAFRFFRRQAAGFVYTVHPDNMVSYRPGSDIEWDDTPEIERNVRKYCEQNFIAVEGLVLCRIEAPCFEVSAPRYYFDKNRIYTPYGGYGDPVKDLEKCYHTSEALRDFRDPEWRTTGTSEVFFNPIDGAEPDFKFRNMRAVFLGMFEQHPWMDNQEKLKRRKVKAVVEELHRVFLERYPIVDDALLDDVAERILPLAESRVVKKIVEDWLDRPISF